VPGIVAGVVVAVCAVTILNVFTAVTAVVAAAAAAGAAREGGVNKVYSRCRRRRQCGWVQWQWWMEKLSKMLVRGTQGEAQAPLRAGPSSGRFYPEAVDHHLRSASRSRTVSMGA
jgi:hypothetical protein